MFCEITQGQGELEDPPTFLFEGAAAAQSWKQRQTSIIDALNKRDRCFEDATLGGARFTAKAGVAFNYCL